VPCMVVRTRSMGLSQTAKTPHPAFGFQFEARFGPVQGPGNPFGQVVRASLIALVPTQRRPWRSAVMKSTPDRKAGAGSQRRARSFAL
jgi:hypothetical protein